MDQVDDISKFYYRYFERLFNEEKIAYQAIEWRNECEKVLLIVTLYFDGDPLMRPVVYGRMFDKPLDHDANKFYMYYLGRNIFDDSIDVENVTRQDAVKWLENNGFERYCVAYYSKSDAELLIKTAIRELDEET